MGVDLDTLAPKPDVAGKGSHGGYCGPAVKPIALNMVSQIANDPACRGLPISGIGGIQAWQDAVVVRQLQVAHDASGHEADEVGGVVVIRDDGEVGRREGGGDGGELVALDQG